MSDRRGTVVFFAFVAAGCAITLGMALWNQKVAPKPTSDIWPKLTASTIDKHYLEGTYSITFTPEVSALDNQSVSVDGFMMPLDSTAKSNHFLLSMRAPSCPYCPPAAPNEMIEIFTTQPVASSDQLTTVHGMLKLMEPKSEMGIFFQIKNAKILQVTVPPVKAEQVLSVVKPLDQYRFTELNPNTSVASDVTIARWFGKPIAVLFWRSDCAPCLKELEALPAMAKHYPHLTIVIISLQDVEHTKQHLGTLPKNVHILVGEMNAREILNAYGNDRALALPYSVMLDAKGIIRQKHYGILSESHIKEDLRHVD